MRPRGTKYQRITIPSDATDPLEPSGLDARLHGGALARIPGWITSNDQLFLLKKTRLYVSHSTKFELDIGMPDWILVLSETKRV